MSSQIISLVLCSIFIVLITDIPSISAYYSNEHHQQQHQTTTPYHHQQQQGYTPAATTVGGSSINTFPTQTTSSSPHHSHQYTLENNHNDNNNPIINYEFISKILRMTCEMNRQLLFGTRTTTSDDTTTTSCHNHPSSSTPTIFHGKTPRKTTFSKKSKQQKQRTGVELWGPNLTLYLRELQSTLQCPPIGIALALIYLDRACSVTSPRSGATTIPPCPYMTPPTIHRLLLTAMVIASEVIILGDPTAETVKRERYERITSRFGINERQLLEMKSDMVNALGDEGVHVSREEVEGLLHPWYSLLKETREDGEEEEEGGGSEVVKETRTEMTHSSSSSSSSRREWSFSYTEERRVFMTPPPKMTRQESGSDGRDGVSRSGDGGEGASFRFGGSGSNQQYLNPSLSSEEGRESHGYGGRQSGYNTVSDSESESNGESVWV